MVKAKGIWKFFKYFLGIQEGTSERGACTRISISLYTVPHVSDFIIERLKALLEICENSNTDFCGYLEVELTVNKFAIIW